MQNKRLITALISTIIVCLSLITVSVAWITMNRRVNSENSKMTIQSVSNVTTISCFALQYDGICGAICHKIGPDAEHGEVSSVTMTEFDKIFRDRNVNTPLIFVVEIGNVPTESDDYISVKVPCTAKYILPETGVATNCYVTGDEDYSIQQYISNVLSVKLACDGNITSPTPTRETRIENNVILFTTQLITFESVTGDQAGTLANASTADGVTTYSKTDYVELKLGYSDYASFLFDATDYSGTSKHLTLYIEFDYYDELMDIFIDHLNESNDNTAFEDDLGTIQIQTGKEGG